MKDRDWNLLLGRMREGNVVPVIGSRLLVDADGTSLYARVATKVLAAHGKAVGVQPLPPFRELNAAIKAEGLVTPTALKQLAQITDFKLMVTLTPDDIETRGECSHPNGRKVASKGVDRVWVGKDGLTPTRASLFKFKTECPG